MHAKKEIVARLLRIDLSLGLAIRTVMGRFGGPVPWPQASPAVVRSPALSYRRQASVSRSRRPDALGDHRRLFWQHGRMPRRTFAGHPVPVGSVARGGNVESVQYVAAPHRLLRASRAFADHVTRTNHVRFHAALRNNHAGYPAVLGVYTRMGPLVAVGRGRMDELRSAV